MRGAFANAAETQPEGRALLHHRDGWTAVAFWDRTGDSRPGSNTAFLLDEVLDFDAAVDAARQAYPHVFARFTFEVVPA